MKYDDRLHEVDVSSIWDRRVNNVELTYRTYDPNISTKLLIRVDHMSIGIEMELTCGVCDTVISTTSFSL